MIPSSASGLGDDTAFGELVDVSTNALTAHARELREFRLLELLSWIDLHQRIDHLVDALVLAEVQPSRLGESLLFRGHVR